MSGPAEIDLDRTAFDDWRGHEPGQHSQLRVFDVSTGEDALLLRTDEAVIEAPNWSPDGRWLIVNRDGLLYRVGVAGGAAVVGAGAAVAGGEGLEPIETDGLSDSNNDHTLSRDGRFIYASSKNGHLYEIPFGGGDARRVTDVSDGLLKRYLHGVSPDGAQLAFIGSKDVDGAVAFNVYTAPVAGGPVRALTHSPKPHDGAEYSPDGQWIYFNSERESVEPGHAQLFRMRVDGSGIQQLTFDERVNWFPHLSPDGQWMLYLSYEPGTVKHPANRLVQLRLAKPDGTDVRVLVELFGGQGTVNVNSWAPDSRRFAYVSYPIEGGRGEGGRAEGGRTEGGRTEGGRTEGEEPQ